MGDAGNKQKSTGFASANRRAVFGSGYSISRVKRRFNMR
jgi:hypothetical protein